jgi:hypothetical protein
VLGEYREKSDLVRSTGRSRGMCPVRAPAVKLPTCWLMHLRGPEHAVLGSQP